MMAASWGGSVTIQALAPCLQARLKKLPSNEFLYLIDYMMLLPLSGWRSNA